MFNVLDTMLYSTLCHMSQVNSKSPSFRAITKSWVDAVGQAGPAGTSRRYSEELPKDSASNGHVGVLRTGRDDRMFYCSQVLCTRMGERQYAYVALQPRF